MNVSTLCNSPNFVSLNLSGRRTLEYFCNGNPEPTWSSEELSEQNGHAEIGAVSAERPSRGDFLAAFQANFGL